MSLAIHKSYLPKKGGSRSSPWMPAIWVAVFAAVAMLCRLIFPGSWQAWALFMGVFAIIAIVMRLFPKASGEDMKPWHRIPGIVFTFHIVCFGWIFFRAPNMGTGIDILEQIFTNMHFALIPEILLGYWEIFALILFGYILHYIPGRMKDKAKARVIKNSLIANAAIIVLIIWVIMQIKSSDIQPFIYFQF